MSDLAHDELLSAYLDGELTADERARVERMLAEQPESRQLLDELRAMKTSLERMPRTRLGHDFADQVLRQAEKELLTTGGAEAADGDGESKVELSERDERRGGFTWQRMRRPLIWASLTLAAGLAIMFLDRDRAARRQVALAPGAAGERDGGEIGAPAGAPAAEAPEHPLGRTQQAEEKSDHDRRSEPSASPNELGLDGASAAKNDASGLRAPQAARPRGPNAAPRDEPLTEPAKDAPERMSVAHDKMSSDAGAAERLSSIAGDQTLVVWCYVTPGADYDNSFRKLLAQQNIKWGEETPVAEPDSLARESLDDQVAETDDRSKQSAEPSARSSEAEVERLGTALRKRAAQQGKLLQTDADAALRDPNTELVLVEASEPQIEAVLEALDRDSDRVVAVDVEPAPDLPRQQQYFRYARGLAEVNELQQRQAGAFRAKVPAKKETAAKAAESLPESKAAADAKQSALPGLARRLVVRPLVPPADADNKPAEQAPARAVESRLQRANKAEATKPTTAGVGGEPAGGRGGAADKDRFQVLFVLHPVEAEKPAARSQPAKNND
ncbi:MAG TPA: zf-HC2 domain-containing protein [Pirellulales bacterium]|nr:zf-HC2 domain-containing protein [Pirellulales bacterium]